MFTKVVRAGQCSEQSENAQRERILEDSDIARCIPLDISTLCNAKNNRDIDRIINYQ